MEEFRLTGVRGRLINGSGWRRRHVEDDEHRPAFPIDRTDRAPGGWSKPARGLDPSNSSPSKARDGPGIDRSRGD